MPRLRNISALVLPAFMVYALVVAGSGVIDCACCHKDIGSRGHEAALCFESHAHADCAAAYHHNPESQGAGFSNPCCRCSILPVSVATSYVPAFKALTSLLCMHGAAQTPCLPGSVVDSDIAANGIRRTPVSSSLNPAIASLQSVFLII